MDFELSEDQVALVEGIQSLLHGRFGIDAVRALEASDGVNRAAWRELADTGVFSLVVPEGNGGVGLGYADAVLVFEEFGRALVPGPIVHTFLVVDSTQMRGRTMHEINVIGSMKLFAAATVSSGPSFGTA